MATYFGINSDTSSNFFNSYFGSSSTSTSGSTSSSASMLSDYYSITNGSYYKLVKAYYAKNAAKETTDDSKKLSIAKSDAEALKKSAQTLMNTDSSSVFKKVTTTDEKTGKVSTGYDKDKIYKSVKSFVDDYNAYIDSTANMDSSSVLQKSLWLVNSTKEYGDSLESMGVTIGSNNKLSIDETKFKAADMTNVKAMFNGSNSFAAKAYQKAAGSISTIVNEAKEAATYNSNAGYNAVSTGAMYDSLF